MHVSIFRRSKPTNLYTSSIEDPIPQLHPPVLLRIWIRAERKCERALLRAFCILSSLDSSGHHQQPKNKGLFFTTKNLQKSFVTFFNKWSFSCSCCDYSATQHFYTHKNYIRRGPRYIIPPSSSSSICRLETNWIFFLGNNNTL